MKASKPTSFDPARLPQGLRERGRPLAVHRPWGDAIADAEHRFLTRIFGANWRDFGRGRGAALQRAALFVLAGVFFCGGLVGLWVYFFNPPVNEDPRWPLGVGIAMFVVGAVAFGLGFFYHGFKGVEKRMTAKSGKPRTDRPDFYLVYQDGLAAVTGEKFEFMEWSAVQEVAWIWIGLGHHLTLTDYDGRQMMVWQHGYTEAGELLLAIFQRVNDFLLPKALKKIAAGKWAKFGPFAISQAGLKYKDRKAAWGDIRSMKLQTQGETRLTIYVYGRLFAWSWCNRDTIPNWDTFYDALCHTAPSHLLTRTTKPRW